MEDQSKRTGSHMVPRQLAGRDRSLTRRRREQAQKQPADRRQSREGGPGSRPTARGAQGRELRTPEDPQLQGGPSGKRAPAAAGRKPSHQPRYKTQAGRRRAGHPRQPQTAARAAEATRNPNKGQGRTPEGAKDNRSPRTYGGPSGNTPGGTGRAETPQTEAGGPTRN